ncbi:ABC transporter permease [Lachnotalea sp. AF33-28]|uniref:ABC transporter permease n=1 Tax=Lachnotalea sp. AF33-28 TaxID=2292046 RepID=UPI000E535E12|nr:ABC transporter permease subunit [Lachnotalea sp. AF33-28]RHP31709.1 sugar ABC transporter permease [Lachnotalea sp. AF33-28]
MGKAKQPAAIAVPKKKQSLGKYFSSHKWLYFLFVPGALYFIVFKYLPMFGIVIAFQQFSPYQGFTGSPWVGLYHFKNLFAGSDFKMLLVNTLSISVLNLVFYFPAPIILALLLNEMKSQFFKRTAQTLVYIPHFISFVIVATLTFQLFNIQDGIVNQVIQKITGHTVNILGGPQYFRGLIVGQSIWKETGYGTIIFLAALSGVDTQLYEAAKVDGAGRLRLLWHITLPAIRGTIVLMLILKVGSILNTGYEQIFLMGNDLNASKAEVFDTYVYKRGIAMGQYSYATAVGLFKSVIGMIMVLSSNWFAKKCGESGLY